MQGQARSLQPGRRRVLAGLALMAVALVTSGFSSCAGTTGPLFAPLTIFPGEVLLRASAGSTVEAIALARIEGGEPGDRYRVTITYERSKDQWLTVEVVGRNLTLFASAADLAPGSYEAIVAVENLTTDGTAALRAEFNVIP